MERQVSWGDTNDEVIGRQCNLAYASNRVTHITSRKHGKKKP